MTKWERMAIEDMSEEELARFYELAGKYQYDAGLTREQADKKAFMGIRGNG